MTTMGYEVLDADGASTALAGGPHAPSDVIALGDLPPVPGEDLPGRRSGDDPGRPRGGTPRRPRLPSLPSLPRLVGHSSRRTYLVMAVLTALGVAAGALWTDHHLSQVRRSELRATVSAVATPMNVSPLMTGQGQMADYTIKVLNLGALPLTVVKSSSAARPSASTPLINIVTGDGTVAPGEEILITARVPVDCSSDRGTEIVVPVLSADGSAHRLALHDLAQTGYLNTAPQQLCTFLGGGEQLTADLTGTLDHPVLALRNNADQPLTVSLDSGSPLTQASSELLSLTTIPALPLTIASHDTQRLRVVIEAHGCQRDLSRITLGGFGYLCFQAESVRPGVTTGTGVDLGPLVGAAVARACQ
jgi:hypothetical protein